MSTKSLRFKTSFQPLIKAEDVHTDRDALRTNSKDPGANYFLSSQETAHDLARYAALNIAIEREESKGLRVAHKMRQEGHVRDTRKHRPVSRGALDKRKLPW